MPSSTPILPFLCLLGLPLTIQAQHELAMVTPPASSVHYADVPDKNKGIIAGKVTTSDGQPAEQVGILIKGSSFGTNTGVDGRFRLAVPAGSHVLVVSYLGVAPQEFNVTVTAGETTTLPTVQLAQSAQQLSEVTVTETRTINQRPTGVGKMPIRPFDLPQSVVTVNQETLEQQQVLRLSDAIVNVSGIYVTSATGGTQEELGSRGFAYNSNNTFKNGVRFNNGVMPEASSLESMEVLKGSAAILYGNVGPGGVLNLVTKKPRFERGGSVSLRAGSFGLVKPIFDVYGAVGQSDKVAFRLNGTYERADSYRDGVKSNRVYVNPSLLFKLTPKTSLVLEGDYLRDHRTPDFGIGAINYEIQESRSRFLNTSDAKNATTQTSATATLTTHLTDAWQLRTVAGFQRYDNQLRSASRPIGIVAKPGQYYGDWQRSLQRTQTAENYYLAEVDLSGTFRTGFLGHTLLIGADADQYNTNTLAYTSAVYDSINVFNRNTELRQPRTRVGGYDELLRNTLTKGNTRRAGFYVQDLLSLSDKLKALVGVRWSYQETPSDVYTYKQGSATTVVENRRYDNAFSPRFGLVYQPVKNTSLFASYSNSFSPNSGIDATGQNLAPSIIDQYEVGIKNDLFHGLLSANVTAYKIVNSNQSQTILPGAPNYNVNIPTAQELAGQVTSKGVELDVQSKPYLGWTFIAGYSYNNTAYTKSNLYENGSRLRYNPAHTANLSLFYNFSNSFGDNTFFKGLTAGVTGYYVGDKIAGRNPRTFVNGKPIAASADAFKLISIPDYMLFDASLGYNYNRFTVRLKLANILDELSYNLHDDNSVNPIAPRNFQATVSYKL
ncbi:TonB-dependent receptor [Hymenobacter crusticola]|uniref:TonB-dependent siderophore receptor n=1 Tax=Hymenobacter crusticola TaxID=1770526 RepID=A0A243WBK1_9BACT|nr:TonB-dependent receptor [Hymenobacter crusticola]OUJ72889.1 TonB-dependent siderophore receptor [Hymenobacter crusticola]